MREEHISFQQQQAVLQKQRQQEIMQAMERAKKYVMSKYKEKYRELRMREVIESLIILFFGKVFIRV